MIAPDERSRHEDAWLLLPWLANGRLTPAERERVEDHIQDCAECEQELALQRRLCGAFAEPDRVIYAPGPSFRKLMDRIDSAAQEDDVGPATVSHAHPSGGRNLTRHLGRVSLWRPPGLAWAASFILLFGLTGLLATAYHLSQPRYTVRSDPAVTPNVLHIALDRTLTIGEVEEMLRTNGARIVEGPGNTGVVGVAPLGVVNGQTPPELANKRLRSLAARLRTDSRVLWVQPVSEDDTSPASGQAPTDRDH
jgi:Putative zinc-finger